LREIESFVVEKNVVSWALGKAHLKEVELSFNELMGIDQ